MPLDPKRIAPALILFAAGIVSACQGGGGESPTRVAIRVTGLKCMHRTLPVVRDTIPIVLDCKVRYTVGSDTTEIETATPNDTIYDPKT